MSDPVGRIVEFLSSGSLVMACVQALAGERLRVVDINGRQHTVAARTVVVRHGVSTDRGGFPAQAADLQAEIARLSAQLDLELLWQSVASEARSFTLEELAREYYGQPTACGQSALFRAILEDAVHFKLKGLSIQARSPGQVTDRMKELDRRREKREFRERLLGWLEGILDSDGIEDVPEDLIPVLNRLESYLSGTKSPEVTQWLTALNADANPKELAFEILLKTGRLPEDADPLLVIAGIQPTFRPSVLESCGNLIPYQRQDGRTDFSVQEAMSIDDQDTREVDDALTLEIGPEAKTVGVHIAEVAHFLDREGLLYDEACRRTSSIYLPTQTVPMLPEKLSMDLASLKRGELRPTLSFLFTFDSGGNIQKWRIVLGQIRVTHRLTYDQADDLLQGDDERAESLRWLDQLAQGLREKRQAQGALTLRKPELKVKASGQEIQLEVIPADSPSRRMVSELMILANSTAAQYAFLQGIDVIYRAQDPPEEPVQVPENYDPVAFDQIFRRLKKSRLTLTPQPHSGLGVVGYTQLTSPIRRLVDLVIQRQISAHLQGVPQPFQQQELLTVLASAQVAERDIKAVERRANRFYTLKYLEKSAVDQSISAVVVAPLRSGYLVETRELLIRGRLSTSDHLEPGQVVTVVVDRIDPEADRLLFGLA